MATLKRRYPNFVSGFEETEHLVFNQQDLLNIDWVKHLAEMKNFHRFSQSVHSFGDSKKFGLMAESDQGKVFYVVGWLTEDLGLPEWQHPNAEQQAHHAEKRIKLQEEYERQKRRVNLEKVKELRAAIDEINAIPITDLVLYEDGKEVVITDELREDLRFMGMTTFSLLEMWPIEIEKVKTYGL